MPREHGRRRTRSARAACRRPAKRNAPSGSPTVFPILWGVDLRYVHGPQDARRRLRPFGRQCAARTRGPRGHRPRTSLWATRSSNLARIFSGGDADQLPARGELGADVRALVDSGRMSLMTGFAVVALHEASAGVASKARRPTACDGSARSIASSPQRGSGRTWH